LYLWIKRTNKWNGKTPSFSQEWGRVERKEHPSIPLRGGMKETGKGRVRYRGRRLAFRFFREQILSAGDEKEKGGTRHGRGDKLYPVFGGGEG